MDIDKALLWAKQTLTEEDLSFVAIDGLGRRFNSKKRGVAPGLELVLGEVSLSGGVVADKVIGKAAAFLFLLLGPDVVYGRTVSLPASAVLEGAGIKLEYDLLVDHIVNREGDGPCPLEHSVRTTDDPHEALAIIKETLSELRRRENE